MENIIGYIITAVLSGSLVGIFVRDGAARQVALLMSAQKSYNDAVQKSMRGLVEQDATSLELIDSLACQLLELTEQTVPVIQDWRKFKNELATESQNVTLRPKPEN